MRCLLGPWGICRAQKQPSSQTSLRQSAPVTRLAVAHWRHHVSAKYHNLHFAFQNKNFARENLINEILVTKKKLLIFISSTINVLINFKNLFESPFLCVKKKSFFIKFNCKT